VVVAAYGTPASARGSAPRCRGCASRDELIFTA
jgi:hypothetical protein